MTAMRMRMMTKWPMIFVIVVHVSSSLVRFHLASSFV